VLLLMNLILFGNFYCYDTPQALESHLINELKISSKQYNLLYSIISMPNILLPFFGGYIADYFGIRKGLLLFQSLITVGQAIFVYGAYSSSYYWMLFGRFVYALGTDTQSVAETALASRWFEGRQQAFAIALSTSMFGFGSTFGTFITPRLQAMSQGLYVPSLFALILCIFSQLLVFVLLYMDKENENREIAARIASNLSSESDEHLHAEGIETTHRIRFSDLRNFKRIFWYLALNYGLAGSIFFTFTNIANDFVSKRFGFSNIAAGDLISSVYISMAIAAPVCGLLVDRYGRRVKVLAGACILGIGVYLLFGLLPNCNGCYTVLIPLIGLGIFLAGYDSGVMPCIPLVLNKEHFATGFGLYFVAQNVTMTIIPIIVGAIQDYTVDEDYGYYWVSMFMVGYAVVTLISCIPIFVQDVKLNNLLDRFRMGGADGKKIQSQSLQPYTPYTPSSAEMDYKLEI